MHIVRVEDFVDEVAAAAMATTTVSSSVPAWRPVTVISPERAKAIADAGYPQLAADLAPESACTRDGVAASWRLYAALAGCGCERQALWSPDLPLSRGHVRRPCGQVHGHNIDQDLNVLADGVDEVLRSAEYQRVFASGPATSDWSCLDRYRNPFPALRQLQGADTRLLLPRLVHAAARLGYPVEITGEDLGGGASGYCDSRDGIKISASLSPRHQAKTAVHEVTHAILQVSDRRRSLTVNQAELIAEATAWLVLQRCGEDSGSFSFPFIAKYGSVRDGAKLQTCAAVDQVQGYILLAATHITAAIGQGSYQAG